MIEALVLAANASLKDRESPVSRRLERAHGLSLDWPAESALHAFVTRAGDGTEALLSARQAIERGRANGLRFLLALPPPGADAPCLVARLGSARIAYAARDRQGAFLWEPLSARGTTLPEEGDAESHAARLRDALQALLALGRGHGGGRWVSAIEPWIERARGSAWVAALNQGVVSSLRLCGVSEHWQALFAVGERGRGFLKEAVEPSLLGAPGYASVLESIRAAAWSACCAAVNRSASDDAKLSAGSWDGDIPWGGDLARLAADRLDRFGFIGKAHRDYGGTGLVRDARGYHLCPVMDGAPVLPPLRSFGTREELIAWLSSQSDYSLGLLAPSAADCFNQTLCREDALVPPDGD